MTTHRSGTSPHRLILVDPSIIGTGGHYLEYAAHVLESAQRRGLDCVLVTNKLFKPESYPSISSLPLFTYDFFGKRPRQGNGVRWLIRKIKMTLSRFFMTLYFILAGRVTATLWGQFRNATRSVLAFVFLVLSFARVILQPLKPLWRTLLHTFRATPVLRRLGPRQLLNGTRKALRKIKRIIIGVFTKLSKGFAKPFLLLKKVVRTVTFYRELRTLSQALHLDQNDLIFWPTLSPFELRMCATYFGHKNQLPRFAFVFRRNISFNGCRPNPHIDAEARKVLVALDVCAKNLPNEGVRFYTDTPELTRDYESLGRYRFETLPIPHLPRPQARDEDGRITLAYVGDAREEKGYDLLPDLVDTLNSRYCDKIRFKIQSNLAGGPPHQAMVAARFLLETAGGNVELFKNPLTSNEYNTILNDADILLLPYSRENYSVRSSGILIEALSLGRPVVVPTASWLSRQFEDSARDWFKEQLQSSTDYSLVVGQTVMIPQGAKYIAFSSKVPTNDWFQKYQITYECTNSNGAATIRTAHFENTRDGSVRGLLNITSMASICFLDTSLSQVRISFLKDRAQPSSSVGAAFHDNADFAEQVSEVIEHIDHYSKTAQAFARKIRDSHGSDLLATMLFESPHSSAHNMAVSP